MSDSGVYGDSVYESGDPDAEDLDPVENLTGDDPDEIMQTGYNPPDREPHHLREAWSDEPSLDRELAAEVPDVSPDDIAVDDEQPRAGRLIAPNEGGLTDDEKDEVAEDVGPAGYASSAEEAAVHVIDEDDIDGPQR